MLRETRCAPVVHRERAPDPVLPVMATAEAGVVDPLVEQRAARAMHRHRGPVRAARELQAVAVLEVAVLVLEVVHDDEQVGLRELVEIAEPRQERRLMRSDDHCGGPLATGTAPCPRVSQLELSSVNSPSGVRIT